LICAYIKIFRSYHNADTDVQVTVAARELPAGSLTENESLSDETVDMLNAMCELSHPSIVQMFGVISPASVPTLVSVTLYDDYYYYHEAA